MDISTVRTCLAAGLLLFSSSAFTQSLGNEALRRSEARRSAGNIHLDRVEATSGGNYNLIQNTPGNIIHDPLSDSYHTRSVINDPQNVHVNVVEPKQNSIVLEADVMINVQASSYVAIFAVTQDGKDVASTDSAMNSRLDIFNEGLKEVGISMDNVHVDFISLIPKYEVEFVINKKLSNNANEVNSGFRMKKNIHVIFDKHEYLDKIITSAAKAEIYDVVKVDYNVDNIKAAYDTLRVHAKKIIDMKREIYHNMGLETKVLNLSEGYDVSYPIQRYDGYTAYHTGNSYERAAQDNPNVQIREKEKVETIFYNKIPYNQFDMVLNADNVEPMVQFYYKLKVRYEVQPIPEKEEEEKVAEAGDN